MSLLDETFAIATAAGTVTSPTNPLRRYVTLVITTTGNFPVTIRPASAAGVITAAVAGAAENKLIRVGEVIEIPYVASFSAIATGGASELLVGAK